MAPASLFLPGGLVLVGLVLVGLVLVVLVLVLTDLGTASGSPIPQSCQQNPYQSV